jgi:hypothetical protein
MLPVLVYLAAVAMPLYLLIRFHERAWYWHAFAIVAAVAVGFVPIPAELQRRSFDLLLGFVFITFLLWGAGGVVLRLRHRIATKLPVVR